MFIASGFQQKSGNKITVGDVIEILEDIMFVIFDLPYISSAIYYIMKYNYGTDDDLELMLDLLKLLLGYETHQNYEDIDEKILVEYERQKEISEIQDLESTSMAETQHRQSGYEDLFDIPFEYDTGDEYPGYFFVVDYEDEEKRKLMIRPKEKIIKSKKIAIVFAYPLSKVAKFEYENKKGFTRMDLFRHIYEGYRKIYDEEEQEVGDPGHYKFAYNRKRTHGKYGIWNHYIEDLLIERVSFSPRANTIEMFIGS